MGVPSSYQQPIPRWLSIYLPLGILVYPLLLAVPGLNWEEGLYREYGLVENLTALFLAIALGLFLRTAVHAQGLLHRCWLILLALGSLLFLGEEISWGQHYFHWVTPEDLKTLNRQGETNLHNMRGGLEFFFTKVAREGLSFGTIVGGILVPLYLRRRRSAFAPGTLQFWLWPPLGGWLAALLSATVRLPNTIVHELGMNEDRLPKFIGEDIGEMKECFLALFILIYAIAQLRLFRRPAAA
jgi:hypothetical protein